MVRAPPLIVSWAASSTAVGEIKTSTVWFLGSVQKTRYSSHRKEVQSDVPAVTAAWAFTRRWAITKFLRPLCFAPTFFAIAKFYENRFVQERVESIARGRGSVQARRWFVFTMPGVRGVWSSFALRGGTRGRAAEPHRRVHIVRCVVVSNWCRRWN